MVAFLPHQAWLSVDAIARVFYRRIGQPPQAAGMADGGPRASGGAPAQERDVPAVAGDFRLFRRRSRSCFCWKAQFAPTSVFVILWAVSPLLMRWMAKPAPSLARKKLSAAETHFLRRIGARNLALLRRSGRARHELAAAGQHATGAARGSGAANVAHQYRSLAYGRAGGARFRLPDAGRILPGAARAPWKRWAAWSATRGICSTGTTRARWSR